MTSTNNDDVDNGNDDVVIKIDDFDNDDDFDNSSDGDDVDSSYHNDDVDNDKDDLKLSLKFGRWRYEDNANASLDSSQLHSIDGRTGFVWQFDQFVLFKR